MTSSRGFWLRSYLVSPIWLQIHYLHSSLVLNVPSVLANFYIGFNHYHPKNTTPTVEAVIAQSTFTFLVVGVFDFGLSRMGNKVVRQEKIVLQDLFSHLNLMPNYLISTYISAVPTLIFDIVYYGVVLKSNDPSEFVAYMFFTSVGWLAFTPLVWLVSPLVADGRPVGESYSIAYEVLRKNWFRSSCFLFVFSLLTLVSYCPCGLGLLITWPMSYLIASLAYRNMVGMPGVTVQSPPAHENDSCPPRPQSGRQ